MTGPVQVTVRHDSNHTVVAPHGRLYFDTIQPLHDALLPLAGTDNPRVVLDLSKVASCDSSGLNLMAQTQRLARRHGGWLRLVAPQPRVRRALEVTNLTRLLPIYNTIAAAVDGA
jgi:anti-sigma B factor antagonist